MTDTASNQFLRSGTAAERGAFTPSPALTDQGYVFYEEDTNQFYLWDGAAVAWKGPYGNRGSFALPADISPSQITSDQNDYNPTSLSTAATLRLSTDASRNITGLQGGADGRLLIVHNVGSNAIVLKDESASSSAANRFALTADVTLAADAVALLQYDSTSSRWRCLSSGSAGAGLSETTGTFTPAITFGGGATGLTYNYQVGRYSRISNRVNFHIAIGINALGSSTGAMKVTGLPLTSKNTTNLNQSVIVGLFYKPAGSNIRRTAYILPNTTEITIWDPDSMAAATQTSLASSGEINLSGTYECEP
jgi:hypothetical protein